MTGRSRGVPPNAPGPICFPDSARRSRRALSACCTGRRSRVQQADTATPLRLPPALASSSVPGLPGTDVTAERGQRVQDFAPPEAAPLAPHRRRPRHRNRPRRRHPPRGPRGGGRPPAHLPGTRDAFRVGRCPRPRHPADLYGAGRGHRSTAPGLPARPGVQAGQRLGLGPADRDAVSASGSAGPRGRPRCRRAPALQARHPARRAPPARQLHGLRRVLAACGVGRGPAGHRQGRSPDLRPAAAPALHQTRGHRYVHRGGPRRLPDHRRTSHPGPPRLPRPGAPGHSPRR